MTIDVNKYEKQDMIRNEQKITFKNKIKVKYEINAK